MGFYLVSLLGAVMLAWIVEKSRHREINDGGWTFLLIAFLVFLSGFRYMSYYGSDEWIYRTGCEALKGIPLKISDSEWLFHIITWLCANLPGRSYLLVFITSLIINTSIVAFLKKYSYSFSLAIFLYVGMGAFMSSMNIIRQYCALSILLWIYPAAIQKKFWKYLLLVVAAAGCHVSAWVMLPIYFVFKQKKESMYTVLFGIAILVLFTQFESIMTLILPYTAYSDYLESILSDGYGVRVLRMLAWIIPYGMLVLFRGKLMDEYKTEYAYIFAAMMNIGILVVATRFVYVARFEVYFSIPSYTIMGLVPYTMNNRSRQLVMLGMVVLFFLYGGYQASISPQYHNIIFEGLKPF